MANSIELLIQFVKILINLQDSNPRLTCSGVTCMLSVPVLESSVHVNC